jgi:Phospholipase_D-nuclease N-terminal
VKRAAGPPFMVRATHRKEKETVLAANDYPFLDIFWTMIIFFAWVIWFWLLITVFGDVFRRHDIGGWAKAAWTIFVIVTPFLGVLIYLIVESKGMAERNQQQAAAAQGQFDSYVKSVAASSPADQIAKGKELLDSGAITQQEFDTLKAKAMA